MKKAIFAVLMLLTLQASADYVYLGAWSKHLPDSEATNENHKMVIYERGNLIGGYYRNSYSDDTVIAGYKFRRQLSANWEASVAVGASYGYRMCFGKSDDIEPKRICPAIFPELVYTRYAVQPSFILMADGVAIAARVKF